MSSTSASAAWRLHLENVQLRAELRAVTAKAPKRCAYCGAATSRAAGVCHAHSDLPAIDPGYHGAA